MAFSGLAEEEVEVAADRELEGHCWKLASVGPGSNHWGRLGRWERMWAIVEDILLVAAAAAVGEEASAAEARGPWETVHHTASPLSVFFQAAASCWETGWRRSWSGSDLVAAQHQRCWRRRHPADCLMTAAGHSRPACLRLA
jgi:hypothetical protein